ncbi:hypothetical protein TVAG_050220 [Trichomonas vaginalis G3]|uniref:Uncharacterized protein n=1 Tax=Trichomonas vaginalis (strain ATCC PRA-98 / G3) TaxID=412133 RepID=A2EJF0_TRIV3|nr:hypothetical protein TVAGG3_0389570 [Trichomonas vaginalis G3]EAY07207.1 hypothetical protein TVAG_050220 [Trichomonas vaginalis G3]KAI5533895.1 hypothetical protein TVAGG3_0389570 [Trichomonas vaginalis G3]|eukprot:XP_001319430.1 hypothetical protein [Trichomonas vaginalis G3]
MIDKGYNKLSLDRPTTVSVKQYVAIYPNDLENFKFQDTSDNNLTWPYWSRDLTEIVITPIFPFGLDPFYIDLEIIGAHVFENCYAVEGVYNGYLRTNPYPGYYNNPICYAFFDQFSVERYYKKIEMPNDNIVYNYNVFVNLNPNSAVSDGKHDIYSISIKNPKPSSVVNIVVYNYHLMKTGDFTESFNNEISYVIPPRSVFVAFNPDGFTFESSAQPIKPGVFYSDSLTEPLAITVKKQGKAKNNLQYFRCTSIY